MAAPEARRWLILSYFSRIDGMACAQHVDDRIPLLRSAGVEPVLLTGPCGERWETGIHAVAACAAPSGIRFEMRHRFRKRGLRGPFHKTVEFLLLLPVLPFYLAEKAVADLDSQWSWFPLAARRGMALSRRYRPELIYSTGGPASAHIAAAWIAGRTGIPWIAEFQDPLVHGDWYRGKAALKAYAFAERYVCARASRVVFLTGEAMRRAAARTALGDRGRVVYPGAEAQPVVQRPRRDGRPLRFAHLGSFGGSRNPAVLLEAVRRLLASRPELSETIRLDFYGHRDAASARLLRDFPVPGMVADHGRVPRRESLSAMREADVLLLIQNIGDFSSETIPSKVYEYFASGRPIVALVCGNPELAGMLRARGHFAADAASPDDVARAISECLDRRRDAGTGAPSAGSPPLTVEEAVDRLLGVAAELLPPRNFP
jgi:glycosyltransferase involved in cell wall biosynthesis